MYENQMFPYVRRGLKSRRRTPSLVPMISIPAGVLSLAEDLNTHIPVSPGDERIITSRYSVVISADPDPHRNVAQRLRLSPENVAAAVAEVRALFTVRGRTNATWEVGGSAMPSNLCERLLDLGMVPDEPEPLSVGMVLTRPLGADSSAVVVRRVTTLEDYRTADSIYRRCFGGDAVDPSVLERRFADQQAVGSVQRYLASIDGEPVAAGEAMYLEAGVVLCGGASLPTARGRGAYRALVRARWEEGSRRGTPILVTQASSMSRPILRRLGFEEVVEIRVFLDRFG